MYCTNCGTKLNDIQDVCLSCGTYQNKEKKVIADENSTFGYMALGFFVPIIGLVLYLLWQTERPLAAKAAGKGALISVIIYAALMIIIFIIYLFFIIIFVLIYGDFNSNFQDFVNLLN
jgi:hypothetical protein